MHRLISKTLNPDFARKTRLLPALRVERQPVRGRVWHGPLTDTGHDRPFTHQRVDFPDLYAWHIPNALITGEFIVHDSRNIYCDSSILVSAAQPAEVTSACEDVRDRLSEFGRMPVIGDYSSEQVMILHNEGAGTWGHYLAQNFPRALLFLDHFPDGKIAVPAVHVRGGSSFSQLFDAYGIARDRLIGIEREACYRVGEAVLVDFLFSFENGSPHPATLELLDRYTPPPLGLQADGIFIERLPKASRSVGNTHQLEEEMARRNIVSMRLGDASLAEQAAAWHDQNLIIGVLGSDLTNLVFARPGARILALSPHWFGDAFFYNFSVARGLEWHEIRCGQILDQREPLRNSTFRVDPELFSQALDAALR